MTAKGGVKQGSALAKMMEQGLSEPQPGAEATPSAPPTGTAGPSVPVSPSEIGELGFLAEASEKPAPFVSPRTARGTRNGRPVPREPYGTRMNPDARGVLEDFLHELRREGDAVYAYELWDALLMAIHEDPGFKAHVKEVVAKYRSE